MPTVEPYPITAVLETCLYATDLHHTAQFYRTVLGLESIAEEGGRHVFFRLGGGVFLLFNPERTAVAAAGSAGAVPTHGAHGEGHVAFAVTDSGLAAWRERLLLAGVPIEADVAWPGGGKSIYVRDPAGNSVELATPRLWGLPDPA